MRAPGLRVCFLMLGAAAASLEAQGPPTPPVARLAIALESEAVSVSGLTPKAKAIFLGVTREVGEDDYPTVRLYQEVMEDQDGDGRVRLSINTPLPKRTLFVVIDGITGNAQAATSAEFGLRLRDWRGEGPGLTVNGLVRLADRSPLARMVLVRPGGLGAWGVFVADGEPEDEDGEVDGGFEVGLDRFVPVGDSPLPPAGLLPSDVVALVDPSSFELVVGRVGRAVGP